MAARHGEHVLRSPTQRAFPVRLRPRAGSIPPPPALPAARHSAFTGVPCVRTVSARSSRRGSAPLVVAAFRLFGKAAAVRVPLDLYAVLNVPPRAPAGAVDDAVVDRTTHPPASSGDLSPGALASRAQLLVVAGSTLASPSSRAAFDTALAAGTASLDVPLHALPGALLLLQECGDTATAIQIGTAALLGPTAGSTWRRDVCHCLALCYADEAAVALGKPTPDLVAAYLRLEHCAALLDATGPASGAALRARVSEALHEYGPEFCLEALGATQFPPRQGAPDALVSAHSRTRCVAKRVLRHLLWHVDAAGVLSPRLKAKRQDFAAQAAKLLTSAENAALFAQQPPHVPVTHASALAGALAALAAGFAQRDVELVRLARRTLLKLPPVEASTASTTVAALPAPQAEAEVSPEESETGTSDAAEAPAADVASPGDAATSAPGSSSSCVPLCVAHMLLGSPEQAIACLAEDAASQTYIRRFDTPLAGGVALVERYLADSLLARFRDTAGGGGGAPPAVVPSLAAWFDAPQVRADLDGGPLALVLAPLRGMAAAQAAQQAAAREKAEGARPVYLPPSRAASLSNASSSLPPGVWALAAALAATSLARGLSGGGGPSSFVGGVATSVASATQSVLDVAITTLVPGGADAATLDGPLAMAVLKRWQAVKASALGGRHDVAALDSVLDGPMLRQWRARAEDVRHNGFFWEYQLTGLSVDAIKITSADGTKAVVEATLQEVAILHDSAAPGRGRGTQGEGQEAYESTYRARYDLVRRHPGRGARAWRIVSGTVLY